MVKNQTTANTSNTTAKEKKVQREAEKAAQTRTETLNVESMIRPDAVASAHGEKKAPTSAGAKVTVACKLGVSFVDLQVCKEVEVYENTQTGPRLVKQFRRVGNVVRIRGTAYPRGTPPTGFPPAPIIIAGAAMNPGVDKEFWDAWVEQNKLNPLVQNGMVFAHKNEAMVADRAKETKDVLSGLDPVNPRGDNRMPKPTNVALSALEPANAKALP